MRHFTQPGRYTVAITGPHWEKMDEKNGDPLRMALVLPCVAKVQGEEDICEYFRIYFTQQIITGGKNRGRSLFEVSAESCVKLGMSQPFSPHKIGELDGKMCEIVMEENTYEGKTSLVPKYLNPHTERETLSAAEANDIWKQMAGGSAPAPARQATGATEEKDTDIFGSDNLPF